MKKKGWKLNRYSMLVVIMLIIFSVIFLRLIQLQVIKVEEFKDKANTKAIRNIPESAPRGEILDRNGNILATSIQSYMLVYNETDESKLYFFNTMDKVLKILKDNGETQQDDFELKVNPFRFEFKMESPYWKRWMELRFKKDRGFYEDVKKKLFKNKKDEELTKEDKDKIDEELLKITPEETFNSLVKKYKITPEENFKNILLRYKDSPLDTIDEIKKTYKISSDGELKNLLDQYIKSPKETLPLLLKFCNVDSIKYTVEKQREYMIVKDTLKMQSFSGYKPVTIASNINEKTAFILAQKLSDLPGIDVSTEPIRYYPNKDLASSILGYITPINPTSKDRYEEMGYDISSDLVGATGIEKAFEDRLKGSKGGKIVKLNKHGRIIEELAKKEPYPGQTVELTIDKNLQYAAEQSLKLTMEDLQKNPYREDVNTSNATRGAAVVLDVNTGKVLALASYPNFDPNLFAVPGRLTQQQRKEYFSPDLEAFGKAYIKNHGLQVPLDMLFPIDKSIENNTDIRKDMYDIYPKPFYNYATSGLTPPGSTFKALTAIAGLQEGVIRPEETVLDKVAYTKNNYTGKCWKSSGHGLVDVKKALEVSCNYFFYEVGDRLAQRGMNTLAKYAWKFGLGYDPKGKAKPGTGIEISERFGQVYNIDYSKDLIGNIYLTQINNVLKTGKDTRGNRFTPIDIVVNTGDSEEIIKLKGEIKELIENKIKEDSSSTEATTERQFSKDLSDKLKNLGALIGKIKKINYTDGDIKAAVIGVSYSVHDAKGEINTPANVYNAAIGQGMNQFTPLQLANYIATFANGGTRYKVHLVDKFLDADGKLLEQIKPEVMDKIDLNPSTVEAVKRGMYEVTTGDQGTAATAFIGFPKFTAGKTGSATFNSTLQDKIGRTAYGVYVGFAPYDKPEIAVSVVIYDGGHGGYAAPVARAIYETYFKDYLNKNYPSYVPMYNFTPPKNQ